MAELQIDPRVFNVRSLEEITEEAKAQNEYNYGSEDGALTWEELLGTDENDPEREYAVKEAFERMDPLLKDIASLCAEGWSQQEIAAHLGVNQSTVSRHVASIREALSQ